MYEYKEKTRPTVRQENHGTAHRKFSRAAEPTQFKLADKKIHNKLVQCFGAKSVIQFRIIAGYGGYWHVHEDHVKYGNNISTRVNFYDDDTAAAIIARLNEVLAAYPGLRDKPGLQECIKWIKRNYG